MIRRYYVQTLSGTDSTDSVRICPYLNMQKSPYFGLHVLLLVFIFDLIWPFDFEMIVIYVPSLVLFFRFSHMYWSAKLGCFEARTIFQDAVQCLEAHKRFGLQQESET